MAWFTNDTKIQELANNLANLHVKYDNLKRKNSELEDKLSNLDMQLKRLEIDNRNLKTTLSENFKKSVTTFPATPSLVDHSNIVTDANIISTVVINPYSTNDDIISSSSYASSCDYACSSDSSSGCGSCD